MPEWPNTLKLTVGARLRREDGQTMTEYALVVVFVAMAVVLGVSLLGINLLGFFDSFAHAL
jgi:Flp pilus assembly pilin Flp